MRNNLKTDGFISLYTRFYVSGYFRNWEMGVGSFSGVFKYLTQKQKVGYDGLSKFQTLQL